MSSRKGIARSSTCLPNDSPIARSVRSGLGPVLPPPHRSKSLRRLNLTLATVSDVEARVRSGQVSAYRLGMSTRLTGFWGLSSADHLFGTQSMIRTANTRSVLVVLSSRAMQSLI
jgi:hypothetical protein